MRIMIPVESSADNRLSLSSPGPKVTGDGRRLTQHGAFASRNTTNVLIHRDCPDYVRHVRAAMDGRWNKRPPVFCPTSKLAGSLFRSNAELLSLGGVM